MSTNTQPYKKLWAIISVDRKGNEGICMLAGPFGPQLAVTGDKKLLETMKGMIQTMEARKECHDAGLRVVVAEYSRTDTTNV